jgi:hypothetical protein
MKKDLTIGGIGARSTSVRRRIMKRVCNDGVTNLNLSDIGDVIYSATYCSPPPVSCVTFSYFTLKRSIVIKKGQILTIKPYEMLLIQTSNNIINYGTINLIGNAQLYIADFIDVNNPPSGGGGLLINNGIINIELESYIENLNIFINNNILISNGRITTGIGSFTNNSSLTNTGKIFVINGGTMTNTGTINNTGEINIANNPGTCGIGNFIRGSYAGTIGNLCPWDSS